MSRLENIGLTTSRRPSPGEYLHATPKSAITRPDDDRALDELKESTERKQFKDLVEHISDAGYGTPFDFALAFLNSPPQKYAKVVKKWLRGDGLSSFIETCTKHPDFCTSDGLNSIAVGIAKVELTNEIYKLAKSSSLRRPLSEFSIERVCNFSLEAFGHELQTTAPNLLSLLESLVLPQSNANAIQGMENDILHVDLDFEDEPDESDELSSQPTSIGPLPVEAIPSPRKTQSRRLAAQIVMSILLYARSQKVNLIPGLLGYFLYCLQTPKSII